MASYLVIAPQGLGDALEATPIVGAIKRERPSARVDALVLRSGPRQLFRGLDEFVDDVLYYPYWERGMTAFLGALFRSAIGRRRYDASILAYPASRPEYDALARVHGATLRVAHDYEGRGSGSDRELRVPVEPKHNVERNLDLVRALDIDVPERPRYLVPRSWRGPDKHPRRIALHIGTVTHHGLSNKRWPVERFTELAGRLARGGYDVGIISGPDERTESRAIVDAVAGARLVEGSLEDVARYLSTCAGAVTNDSGIGHLAAALDTTVIALHGPTPVEGGPYGPHAVRFRPSRCPPCFDPRRRNTACALGIDFACLKDDLPVDLVEERLLREMADGASASSR